MDLQKISSGMDNGPEAIQKNFEAVDQAVENMGGAIKRSPLVWAVTRWHGNWRWLGIIAS